MKNYFCSLLCLCLAGSLSHADLSSNPIGKPIANPIGKSKADASPYSLEVTFIDVKKSRNGSRTDFGKWADEGTMNMGRGFVVLYNLVAKFLEKNWSMGTLAPYHKSTTKLYADYLYMPMVLSDWLPQCFGEGDVHKNGVYLLYYKGTVRAPRSGKFRFVSMAFDSIYVRFNKKLVLEAGYCAASLYKDKSMKNSFWSCGVQEDYRKKIDSYKGHEGYKFYDEKLDVLGGLIGGNVFSVKEGEEYPIEILVVEANGNSMGFDLLIEDVAKPTRKDGKRTFDLFRTSSASPDLPALEEAVKDHRYFAHRFHFRDFNEDSPVWGDDAASSK